LAAPQSQIPLPAILRAHAAWLENPLDGYRADLSALTLNDADLHGVTLARASWLEPPCSMPISPGPTSAEP